MTSIPERVNHRWVSQLDDSDLSAAESTLHADFTRQDRAEKNRAGTKYRLLEGPPALVDAWMSWRMVNDEAKRRGLPTHHRA